MDKNEIIKIFKKYIKFLKKNKYNVINAYLFGSIAKGNSHEESDIDIAIVVKGLQDSFTSQIEMMTMRRQFDIRIEPHPFEASDFNLLNPFTKDIINTGIKIL